MDQSDNSGLAARDGGVDRPAAPASPTQSLVSDEQVVRRVLGGDLACFELIMRRYNQRLFRIARSIVNDDHDAEDVMQETYVHAFEHLAQFEGRSRFSTWLTRIAVHEASARRGRRRRMHISDFHGENEPQTARAVAHRCNGEEVASRQELSDILASAVKALPDELRRVFVLRVVEGLDTEEAAECLELSIANTKVRLHRARAILRASIDGRIGKEARRLFQFNADRCDRVVRTVLTQLSTRAPA